MQNILGRVTGGSASSIDGLIRSMIPGADLYLINPFGILFGPNASLDVQGSFHATTADYVRLQDGSRFNAAPSSADVTLTVAPPEAFGFLGDNPAGISVVGDASDNLTLQVPAGETLSLIGGDIEVQDRVVFAAGGRINLAGVGSQGEVELTDSGMELSGSSELGDIHVSQGGVVSANGAGGGAIFIRGGEFVVEEESLILANTLAGGEGVGIDVDLTGQLTVQEGSRVTADILESGTGTGGDVTVRAGSLEVLEGAQISANTFGAGNGGSLTVKAGSLEVLKEGQISAGTFGAGNGGSLLVEADQIRLSGAGTSGLGTGIFAQANPESQGNAGDLTVRATGSLAVVDGGVISAEAQATGDAGDLTVQAGSLEVLDGAEINAATIGTGKGGTVVIIADDLNLQNGGAITTLSGGPGLAGDIEISVDGLFRSTEGRVSALADQSSGGNIVITADSTQLTDSEITASVFGSGETLGGNVTVNGKSLILLDGSRITARATQGRGGFITINTEAFLHDGRTLSDVLDASSDVLGNAGTVAVNTPEQDLSGSIEHLPAPFLNVAALLQDRCSTRTAETASTFIIRGPNVQTGPGEAWGASGASILPDLPSLKDTRPAPRKAGDKASGAHAKPALKVGCADY